MAETTGSPRNNSGSAGKISGRLFAFLKFFWKVIFLAFVVGLLSGLVALFVPGSFATLVKNMTGWIFGNLLIVGLFAVILALLTYMFYRGSRSPAPVAPITPAAPDPPAVTVTNRPQIDIDNQPHITIKNDPVIEIAWPAPGQATQPLPAPLVIDEDALERSYLLRMIDETEKLKLAGIPADLFTMFAPNVPLDEVFIPMQFFPKRHLKDYPFTSDEALDYRERLQKGLLSEDMQRVLLGKEREWEEILRKGDKLDIAAFWGQLTQREPAAVAQGYPGMGKSTLMARLTLHFARLGLGIDDPTMGQPLSGGDAPPVPVLLLLKEYAAELRKAAARSKELSVLDYLRLVTERMELPGLFALLRRRLAGGRCLVILDGLDEVSDIEQRRQVKKAIETFISNHRRGASPGFNRFVITSRVAGYDVVAFEDYTHFTLAELTSEQINHFLPRWCRASARCSARPGASPEAIERSAVEMERSLQAAIATQPGMRKLAEIPLLLTLLAVMRQNKIELPRQRIDLYKLVTRTLLEDRNIARDLPPIQEAQAIERLGPIAFDMQERGNNFAQQWEVKAKLTEIVAQQGGTPKEIQDEVANFLERVRVRGGLFVIRTGDYFGFFHRTFQEYFVARYLLNQVSLNPGAWIPRMVEYARSAGDTWREPFLLAVAYQSGENVVIARKIIAQLLELRPAAPGVDPRDLILAAACIVEAKPASTGSELEGQIARLLLQTYEAAQRRPDFKVCDGIETVTRDWLLSLPAETYRPALLVALTEAITNAGNIALQRAVLTMLTMIAQQLAECHPLVFDTLIPPLLGLAGLPAIGNYQPINPSATPDYTVSDLALTALSFMDKRGPAGLMLAEARRYFTEHPEHLRLLAQFSLESGALLTLTVVPTTNENYQRYEQAIGDWITLRERLSSQRVSEKDIDFCLRIHRQLLDCAQEATYPAARHLLSMLRLSAASPARPWQEIWQGYFLQQLKSGNYLDYQEAVFLYTSLFPDQPAQMNVVSPILADMREGKMPVNRFAQRFVATLAEDLRYL